MCPSVRSLSELEVLIVDCQATGATPAHGAVLEIGWCLARRGETPSELQAHWIALPDGHTVPPLVRRLTGFEERCASEALAPDEAWRRLRASVGHRETMPAAIHFARFELCFLREWASRFEPERPFPLEAVCVHAAAQRLFPELPRRTLRALAGYLGYGLDLTRSSLGHVQATAFIWSKLCEELAGRGVHTWTDLTAFLATKTPSGSRNAKRRYPMPRARYRALPDAPGVYRFVRCNGDVLYVGKAASLRKRVASHFTTGATTEQALEMLTQTSDIVVTGTATPLEAALLENETIKALRPPYNVQLVNDDPRVWFASDRFDAALPAPDAVHRAGPLPSRFGARPLGALLALFSGVEPTPALRAWAVGATALWAPDPSVFARGLDELCARHGLGLRAAGSESDSGERRAQVQRSLVLLARTLLLTKGPKTDDASVEEPSSGRPSDWDPERVARHLERALAQAYQLLRRARWLCLLRESSVVYREPGRAERRLLVIRDGELVEARDLGSDEPPPPAKPGPPLASRRERFDRPSYDRLRILTTELKRVRRDGGSVAVHLGPNRVLGDATLDAVLRFV